MKIKSLCVVCFLLALVPLRSFSQAQVALGLKGGLNLSKLDIKAGASNIDNRTGFHGGAFGLIKLTKIGIQPEILFSKQGSNFKFDNVNYEANFDYINVPVLLKLYLAAGLNIQLGPQFSFLSTSELVNTANGVKDAQSAKNLFDKKSDIVVAAGLGWDLPFGVTIDARYNIGLSDIEIKPTTSSTNPINFKSQVIQVSLGYKIFKLGK
jgi:Outer membrane protein beta-barrel domain